MLNVGSIGSSGGMAGYMTSLESQLDTLELQGAQWGGSGAEELGLRGAADADAIERVLDGELPAPRSGTAPVLPGVSDPARRKGTEFIISAPKSVSMLAVTYGDKRLIEAHSRVEKKVMAYAEKESAKTRIQENNEVRTEKTGKLVYARSTHGYDDAGKPHLHSHIAIANMTQSADGKWRALDNSGLWANSAKYGANYLRLMADEVRKLGYAIAVHANGKGWDIVDVPKEAIANNSARGTEIKAALAMLGRDSHGANRVARFETRENIGKETAPATLNERNQASDRAAGFDGASVVADAARRGAAPTTLLGAVGQTVTQAYRDVIERLDARSEVKLLDSPYLPKNIRSLTQSPGQARAYVAIAHAIAHNEQREAAFLERVVIRDALNLQHEGVTIEMLDKVLVEHKQAGLIVEGKNANPNNPMITTKSSLEREQAIIDAITAARHTSEPRLPSSAVEGALREHLRLDANGAAMTLNDGQLGAAQLILSAKDGIVLVQGFSGTGKTATIGPVAAHETANGGAIFGIAPSKTAVEELASVGLASTTITAFLNETRAALLGDKTALMAAHEKYKGATLIVDESSMVGNRDFEAITALHAKLGLNKTVFVGDKRQLQAVDQGKAFEVVQTMRVARAEISDVVRQRDPALKTYNEQIRTGNVGQAFAAIRDHVHEVQTGYVEAAVNHYLRLDPNTQRDTLLITAGNADRQRADQLVQAGLKAQGRLEGEARTITIHDDKGLTDAEMRQANRYEPGDVMRLAKFSPSLGLKRGDYAVGSVGRNDVRLVGEDGRRHNVDVRAFEGREANEAAKLLEPREIDVHVGETIRWTSNDNTRGLVNNKQAQITAIERDAVSFQLANGEALTLSTSDPQMSRIDLAYAVNAHKVQGASSRMAIWAAQSDHRLLTTLRQAYVNGTRAIHRMHVYTDDSARLEATLGATNSDKTSALEVTGRLDQIRKEAFDAELMAGLTSDLLEPDGDRVLEQVLPGQHDREPATLKQDEHDDEGLFTSLRQMAADLGVDYEPGRHDQGHSLSLAHLVPMIIDQERDIITAGVAGITLELAVPPIPGADPKTTPQADAAVSPPSQPEPVVMIEKRLDFDIS